MATPLPSTEPTSFLLYVESPTRSAAFYTRLLGRAPVEASANFVMYALSSGLMFGLWARADAEPAPGVSGAGGELCFALADRAAVDERYGEWSGLGLRILQTPTAMDFGYTFTAADPDGHRLRVFAPGAA